MLPRVLLGLLLAELLSAAAGTALGCNAGEPGDRGLMFADFVKTSTFGIPTVPGSQNVSVDARGWPTADFSLLFLNEPGGYYYPAADLSGTYTITAIGCATVSVPAGYNGLTIVNQSCAGGSLLAFLDISGNGDAVAGRGALAFTGTSRGAGLGGGLTNLSLLLPGYPAGTDPDTLHEPALANMRGRCTVTRFLGWAFYGHTQWDGVTPPTPCDWSIRPRLGDATYFLGGWGTYGLGVPYEIILRIANAIGSDVWFNVPSTVNETARDEYIVSLMTLADSMLPAGRKMYIEYANECVARALGLARRTRASPARRSRVARAPPARRPRVARDVARRPPPSPFPHLLTRHPSPAPSRCFFGNNQCYQDDTVLANVTVFTQGDPYRLNFGLPSPPNASYLISHYNPRMYAYTALHIAALARAQFGAARVGRADAPGVRVVPVVGALGSYATDGESKLAWLYDAWGPPAAAGLATMNIGAYFGAARNVSSDPAVTVDEEMESMLAAIAAASPLAPTAWTSAFAGFAATGAYYGVALHAYEGGPDTSGGKGAGVMTLARACVDPRMEDAVTSIVATWQAWTGGTFNYFTLGAQPLQQPWGSYTILYDLKVPDTPKSRGIDKIVASPPAPLTAGWLAPVYNHSAAYYVGYYTKNGLPPTDPVVSYLPLNTTLRYLVRFDAQCAAGTNVTVHMATSGAGAGGDPLEVSVGAFLPPVVVAAPPGRAGPPVFSPVTALFPQMPAAALANGLVTVRLRVPVEGVKYRLLSLDVTCR